MDGPAAHALADPALLGAVRDLLRHPLRRRAARVPRRVRGGGRLHGRHHAGAVGRPFVRGAGARAALPRLEALLPQRGPPVHGDEPGGLVRGRAPLERDAHPGLPGRSPPGGGVRHVLAALRGPADRDRPGPPVPQELDRARAPREGDGAGAPHPALVPARSLPGEDALRGARRQRGRARRVGRLLRRGAGGRRAAPGRGRRRGQERRRRPPHRHAAGVPAHADDVGDLGRRHHVEHQHALLPARGRPAVRDVLPDAAHRGRARRLLERGTQRAAVDEGRHRARAAGARRHDVRRDGGRALPGGDADAGGRATASSSTRTASPSARTRRARSSAPTGSPRSWRRCRPRSARARRPSASSRRSTRSRRASSPETTRR